MATDQGRVVGACFVIVESGNFWVRPEKVRIAAHLALQMPQVAVPLCALDVTAGQMHACVLVLTVPSL
jgi:hypothetical protein